MRKCLSHITLLLSSLSQSVISLSLSLSVLCHDHGFPQLPSFCCSQQHLLFYNTVFAVFVILVSPLRFLAVSLELGRPCVV